MWRLVGIAGILLWGSSPGATAQERVREPASIERRYVELFTATLRQDATPQDVDNLLLLYTENVVYEHPRAGARIEGKDKIRQAMLQFLGAMRNPDVKVESALLGRGVAVLELQLNAEAKRDAAWEPLARRQIMVLELEGSRIRRLIEYW
jgi:ketosteroid isomerase-like protein